jgi:Uncharacterized conserved protein
MSHLHYLKLEFKHEGRRVATIKIASETEHVCTNASFSKGPVVECKNVKIIEKREDLDGKCPIILNDGIIEELPLLLLLEETDYEIKIEFEKDFMEDNPNKNFETASLKILKEEGGLETISLNTLLLEKRDGVHHGALRFKSYVGKSYFDISFSEWTERIPFEVRSKKIDYLKHYPMMISDISEAASSFLISNTSPLYSDYTSSNETSETFYEDYMLLEYIMRDENLPSFFETVKRNVVSKLETIEYRDDVSMIKMIDEDVIMDIISSPNLSYKENGMIFGKYNIDDVLQKGHSETIDVPENRLIKDFLKTIDYMISTLILNAHTSSEYISARLQKMSEISSEFLSESWISEIGDLTYVPQNSMILHKKAGYRDIFKLFHMLYTSINISVDEMEDVLKGNNRKLHQIYEFWCYIKLFEILKNMSTNKPEFKIEKGKKKWVLSFEKIRGTIFKIPSCGYEVNVELFYEKEYLRKTGEYRSYSLEFEPDFSLKIWKDDEKECVIIHFDSKYKAKDTADENHRDQKSTDADIYKMHTYRDAILLTGCAFVLYPGDRHTLFRKHKDAYFPRVGARCLNPGNEKNMTNLRVLIQKTIKSFIKLNEEGSGEIIIS